MSRNRSQSDYNPVDEFEYALNRWARLANEVVRDSVRAGQPLMNAYLRGVSAFTPAALRPSSYRAAFWPASNRCCEIPETECPPRCVCELSWDARRGDVVEGTLDISNTGKQAVNFGLEASDFTSDQGDSGVAPTMTPENFSLAPGETKKVAVSVQIGKSFDANERYRSEITVRGRYEQCVQLSLYVRRRQTPHCKVDHGEIPKRIVAHHWYDHFQCEELCFEPVKARTPGTAAASTTADIAVTAGNVLSKDELTASKRGSNES